MKYVFAGDSWALKGYTEQNYHFGNTKSMPDDTRLADHWPWPYELCLAPGKGNLTILEKFVKLQFPQNMPVVWVYTEPGRDYGTITGKNEFDWIRSEEIFEIRHALNKEILQRMRDQIKNPVALIGGLSDIDTDLANKLGFHVIHNSWQAWTADKLNSQWFKFGWGASDIGWRTHHNNVTPSKAATFAWDEQIKEWCWWEDNGYFCHEHPTPKSNKEFAEYLKPKIQNWLK
jgi:hypothetical protein